MSSNARSIAAVLDCAATATVERCVGGACPSATIVSFLNRLAEGSHALYR
eukprot:CAMPEP_0117584512 /NCGR_PEP_ID=MMETSP0784-20121206/67643_1 /TAXON_ID=39447 /ORGANISM="" /LENGTH=49 /DNA_ID=CAMNT_0005385381 /DNA_START=34 /DNA_END=183 /DNA_ORIENTATION=+